MYGRDRPAPVAYKIDSNTVLCSSSFLRLHSMRKRTMAAITLCSRSSLETGKNSHQQEAVKEEVEGLIRVYNDGHVERPQIVPCVTTALAPELGVTSQDIVIDKATNIWARLYVPLTYQGNNHRLPLIVYFHGGGFCVGSVAWCCYHEFLASLAATAGCLIMSVNYRLAPENPLPAAYEDGITALIWLKQQAMNNFPSELWSRQCNFSNIYLAGDSAGANIAYNVVLMLASLSLKPLILKGAILIQPFFGGELRTNSEKYLAQSPQSALSLPASDTYWRLALPAGASRDHPWCNPLSKGSVKMEELKLCIPNFMVCIAEMDILKDRDFEFVAALARAGVRVQHVVHRNMGHAFQVLSRSQLSQNRTLEMMSQVKVFIAR